MSLRELQGTIPGNPLPPAGALLFFYDSEQSTWGYDPNDRGSWAVIYEPEAATTATPLPDGIPAHARYTESAVSFAQRLTLLPWESAQFDQLGLSDAERDRYFDLLDLAASGLSEGSHQVLGHPDPIQGDMQLECQLASNGLYCGDESGYKDRRRRFLEPGVTKWRLLFQVDSDEKVGMQWGDVGRLYFWITETDLQAHRFENSWMILQCS